mmetsp:Transcript_26717/g.49025  ORF Transcript_26717/g.49025 Transcript_26717/m.49025 type:complete len:84 (+) Transcript_26717:126-377(+)
MPGRYGRRIGNGRMGGPKQNLSPRLLCIAARCALQPCKWMRMLQELGSLPRKPCWIGATLVVICALIQDIGDTVMYSHVSLKR